MFHLYDGGQVYGIRKLSSVPEKTYDLSVVASRLSNARSASKQSRAGLELEGTSLVLICWWDMSHINWTKGHLLHCGIKELAGTSWQKHQCSPCPMYNVRARALTPARCHDPGASQKWGPSEFKLTSCWLPLYVFGRRSCSYLWTTLCFPRAPSDFFPLWSWSRSYEWNVLEYGIKNTI